MCLVLVRDSLSPAGRRLLMTVIDVLILLFAIFVITLGGFKLALSAQKVFSALLGIPRSWYTPWRPSPDCSSSWHRLSISMRM